MSTDTFLKAAGLILTFGAAMIPLVIALFRNAKTKINGNGGMKPLCEAKIGGRFELFEKDQIATALTAKQNAEKIYSLKDKVGALMIDTKEITRRMEELEEQIGKSHENSVAMHKETQKMITEYMNLAQALVKVKK